MARVQTRRALSLSRLTMAKLQIFAENRDVSMSGLVEYWIGRGLTDPFDAEAYASWNGKRLAAINQSNRRPRGPNRVADPPRPIVQPEQIAPGQYAHLFGQRCHRCGVRGHYAKTCTVEVGE